MKNIKIKILFILLCIFQFMTVLFNNQLCLAGFSKEKIAVLDFEFHGEQQLRGVTGAIVAEAFTTALVKDGRFEVVERALLVKIIEEQKLGQTGLIDTNSTVELGKILGVNIIISGSIMHNEKRIDLYARAINVKSASIIAAENVSSNTGEALQETVNDTATKIVRNFPLEGYIIKRNGKNVSIDIGSGAGLQPGVEFFVYQEGETLKHPKTGEVLEVEKIKTGRIRVIELQTRTASAEIIEEIGDQVVSYGQLVQSIPTLEKQKAFIEKKAVTSTTEVNKNSGSNKSEKSGEKKSGITRKEAKESLNDKSAKQATSKINILLEMH